MLRSRCAGEAALIDTATTAVIASVGSAVTTAAAPPPVAAPLLHQPRSRFPVRALPGTRQRLKAARWARMLGALLMGAALGVNWVWRDRPEAPPYAQGHVRMPTSVPALTQDTETVENGVVCW